MQQEATEKTEKKNRAKGQVSKLAKQGVMQGWLRKDGRVYALTGQT
jgi:hypothetical protein